MEGKRRAFIEGMKLRHSNVSIVDTTDTHEVWQCGICERKYNLYNNLDMETVNDKLNRIIISLPPDSLFKDPNLRGACISFPKLC